jgi:hypothetical protein
MFSFYSSIAVLHDECVYFPQKQTFGHFVREVRRTDDVEPGPTCFADFSSFNVTFPPLSLYLSLTVSFSLSLVLFYHGYFFFLLKFPL